MSLFKKKDCFTLFQYPTETNYKFVPSQEEYKKISFDSREEYYYIFGRKFLTKYTLYNDGKWRQVPRYLSPKYNKIDIDNREQVVEFYKNKFGLFTTKEYIPFEYWADHDSLQGESLSIINHPVFQYAEQYILADHIKKYDTLVIASCSDSKPYDRSSNYSGFKKICEGRADFVVLSNSGVIPLRFSYYYPFLHYNWNHNAETPELSEAFIHWSILRLKKFINKFGYKRIILFAPFGGVYWTLFNRLEGDFEKIFIMDQKEWEQQIKTFGPMAKLRLFSSPNGRAKLASLLGNVEIKETEIIKEIGLF